MKNKPTVGFITPPGWFDPGPDEFRHICQGKVGVQQTLLDLPDFDWATDSIAQTEPQPTLSRSHYYYRGRDLAPMLCSMNWKP